MNSSEIAKLAHVSRTTVSRVLNGHASVSEETRKRVEAVIREHNYFPDAAARNLVGKPNKILALFIIDLAATRADTPPATTRKRGRPSTGMCWAGPRQRPGRS